MKLHPSLALVAATSLTMALASCGGDRESDGIGRTENVAADATVTYEYRVPFGTGERIDSGEVVEIMPSELTVQVGESIRIINDDLRDYMIGPFFVMAGQTLAMRFTNPGVIEGVCQVNPEGRFAITVLE